MKKILNDPFAYADETLEGMTLAFPQYYAFAADSRRVIVRPSGAAQGKVGIVTGGGSGHLPVFAGYVGAGLLDACAVGDVFASPSAEEMARAMRAADGGRGVLRLYGNYGGDVMNFDLAGELVEMDDIESTTVLLADDVASAPRAERDKRRGVTGMVFAFKIAGASAARGDDLATVTRIAQKTADSVLSMAVALSPCTVPQAGKPTFEIGETEMEVGMGIHGEPGVKRMQLGTADAIADALLEPIVAEHQFRQGERLSLLLNSLGATPVEELFILYRRLAARFAELDVAVVRPLVGRYATSMEMAGVSLTVLKLDDELEPLLAAPADCAFWTVA
jgi:dihydroxyacetone kinase-like protein